MRVELTAENISLICGELERDLQREMRSQPPYCYWSGEEFISMWSELWTRLQLSIRRFGVQGQYATDSRANVLRQRLVDIAPDVLPSVAMEHRSI